MARKRARKTSELKVDIIRTFPELHDGVISALEDSGLTPDWVDRGSHNKLEHDEEYSTWIMGTFRCTNPSCKTRGWGSKKVNILIRGYNDCEGYNAEVYNQRCRACSQLGLLTLDESSYVDRVAYRIKKWVGVAEEAPPYVTKLGPPHEEELCEGCQAGYCQKGGGQRLSGLASLMLA